MVFDAATREKLREVLEREAFIQAVEQAAKSQPDFLPRPGTVANNALLSPTDRPDGP